MCTLLDAIDGFPSVRGKPHVHIEVGLCQYHMEFRLSKNIMICHVINDMFLIYDYETFDVLISMCASTWNLLSNQSTHGKRGCMEDVHSITRRGGTMSMFPPNDTHFLCSKLKSS
jgi:hypothetical protein